jgi:hypothetical protein
MVMDEDNTMHRLPRRWDSGYLKAALIVVGLIAAGIVAAPMADTFARQVHAIAAPTPQSFASPAIGGNNVPDSRLSTDARFTFDLSDELRSSASSPRECRPDQGVVDNCVY